MRMCQILTFVILEKGANKNDFDVIRSTKQQIFDIKQKLKVMVDELAVRQIEFGGVTIDRDYFLDKKNANPYNYSTDFPPTLKDLSSRILTRHKTLADFKFDYKLMCKKLTENLKEDFEKAKIFVNELGAKPMWVENKFKLK